MQYGQHAPASRTIVHISDTHLLAAGARLYDRYDTQTGLERMMRRVELLGSADALVFTGDLTDLGEPDAYAAVERAVRPVAERLGARVVWVAGNHDERPEMRRDLLGLEASEAPITSVTDLDGLRIVALDSTVPGWHHGAIDAEQLAWLTEVLREPAPLGTILALHHPPLPSHLPVFDILELQGQDALAAAIAGSDVRAILAGHLHYAMSGVFAGVPAFVASASCYTMDLAAPARSVNGMDAGQSFHLVQVFDDVVTASVVPVASADASGIFSEEWYARLDAMTPAERLEFFSRKRP
ncbi:metallophosphoesterase [Microbacterium excoecariae]|uniref:metallophosphoesterase n=1 Tax=Microbacterium excoecariae TaxID=2715210 RepID=UPI001409FD7F|nr:metallophosphoesterase [Microbacterium excoecariae]NHI16428.1 phosphodiesterase [Microbacterium excoecariae]